MVKVRIRNKSYHAKEILRNFSLLPSSAKWREKSVFEFS
jgi:hypothetical protein